jgi:positive regulator of sigma E activity
MKQEGIVRSVSGDKAVIALPARGCAGCGRRSACGIGKLAPAGSEALVSLSAEGLDLAPGMAVTLEVPGASLTRAAAGGYLVPALAMLAGAIAGHLAGGDPWAAGGALAGLACGVALTRFLAPRNALSLRGAPCRTCSTAL